MPPLNTEYFWRQRNLHILLDLDLAGQPHTLARLTSRNMTQFSGQYRSTAGIHLYRADSATTFSAASGRNEDLVSREGAKKRSTGARQERFVRVAINRYCHIASSN